MYLTESETKLVQEILEQIMILLEEFNEEEGASLDLLLTGLVLAIREILEELPLKQRIDLEVAIINSIVERKGLFH